MLPKRETLACTTVDLFSEMNPSFSRKSGWPTGREGSLRRLWAPSKGRPLCFLFPPAVLGSYLTLHVHVHSATDEHNHCPPPNQISVQSIGPASCSWASPLGALEEGITGEEGKVRDFVPGIKAHQARQKSDTKLNTLIFWVKF